MENKKLLKDYPNHLAAFEYAEKLAGHYEWGFVDDFLYIYKLMELDPRAVFTIPGWKIQGADGVFYVFLTPMVDDPDDYLESEMVLDCLYVDGVSVHDKTGAAKWCGVTVRQLERWMRGGEKNKFRDPLRFIKNGKDRYFFQDDLWSFMCTWGVGERWKHVGPNDDPDKIIPEIGDE